MEKEKKPQFNRKHNSMESPDIDGGWAWVVAFAGFCATAVASGLYYTFSLYFVLLLEEFHGSRSETAWVGSLFSGIYMLAGPIATYLLRKFSHRAVIMLGGVLTMAGFVSSSFAPNLMTLYFTYGVLAAFGCCLSYTGWIIAISSAFHTKYSIAFSLSQAGVGIGMFMFSPIYTLLAANYGWRGSFLIAGAISFHFTLFGALIFKPRQQKYEKNLERVTNNLLEKKQQHEQEQTVAANTILRDIRGWLFHCCCFCWLLATLIIYILLGDFCNYQSLDDYYIYMLTSMGFGDLVARLLVGPLVQHVKIDVVVFYGLSQIFCSLIVFFFSFINDGIIMVVHGTLFSATYGFQCVLSTLTLRHIFGSENLNMIFGVNCFFGGAGILIGSPLAGTRVPS